MNNKTKYILILSGLAAIAVMAQSVVATLSVNVTDEQRQSLRWYARQMTKSMRAEYDARGDTNYPPDITWQAATDALFQQRMNKIVREHKAWLDGKVAAQYSNADTNTQDQIKTLLNVQDN